jgi:dTDP-4-dehydrorhamnose 3,5-epimerase-like enzyme
MHNTKISDCEFIQLEKHDEDNAGSLSVIENTGKFPFEMKRVFYLYDIPAGQVRAKHAHKDLQEILFALTGSLDVVVDDGKNSTKYTLNQANLGIYLPAGLWCELNNFSQDAVCLVLASDIYMEEDYIRDYDEFLAWKRVC